MNSAYITQIAFQMRSEIGKLGGWGSGEALMATAVQDLGNLARESGTMNATEEQSNKEHNFSRTS